MFLALWTMTSDQVITYGASAIIFILASWLLFQSKTSQVKHYAPSLSLWKLTKMFFKSSRQQTTFLDLLKLQRESDNRDCLAMDNFMQQQRVLVVNGWLGAKEMMRLDKYFQGRHASEYSDWLLFKDGIGMSDNNEAAKKGLTKFTHSKDGFGSQSTESAIEEQCWQLNKKLGNKVGLAVHSEPLFVEAGLVPMLKLIVGDEVTMDITENEKLTHLAYMTRLTKLSSFALKYSLFKWPISYITMYFTAYKPCTEAFKIAQTTMMNMINKREEITKKDTSLPNTYVDEYLKEIKNQANWKDGKTHTYTNLMVVITELSMAAMNSISRGMANILMLMAQYPDIQKKVQAEIHNAIGKSFPRYNDNKKMVYTEAVILETLRHNPNLPMTNFHRASEDCKLLGYDIDKNSLVMMNVYAVLHDERYWKDPDVFNPNRFINSDGQLVIPEQYITFSFGKRNCFGKVYVKVALFLIFTFIMQHYTVSFPPGQPPLNLDDKTSDVILIVPDHKIIFTPK